MRGPAMSPHSFSAHDVRAVARRDRTCTAAKRIARACGTWVVRAGGARWSAAALLLLAGACGGADGEPPERPAAQAVPAAAAAERSNDADAVVAELGVLATDFFEALAAGDGERVWSLLAQETRAAVSLQDVVASAAAVRQAYDDPTVVLEGIELVSLEGERAAFYVSAYYAERGPLSPADRSAARASGPLVAVREGGRWRLAPPLSLFQLGDLQISVE